MQLKSFGDRCSEEFEDAVPRINRHASIVFRSVKCSHKRADCIAEAVALAWKWWVRLRETGKNPNRFISAIATFAARAVSSGRRLCGQEKARDVLSPLAQQRHNFTVRTLDTHPFAEALRDNTQTSVQEQVAFRIDFPAWLATYDERRRRMIEAMGAGERTLDLAEKFGTSPVRISQQRREFMIAWFLFVED